MWHTHHVRLRRDAGESAQSENGVWMMKIFRSLGRGQRQMLSDD